MHITTVGMVGRKILQIQEKVIPHDLVSCCNHYRRWKHSLRAKHGSGSSSQPRRVWPTWTSCNIGDWTYKLNFGNFILSLRPHNWWDLLEHAGKKVLHNRKETSNPAVSLSNKLAVWFTLLSFLFAVAPITTSEVPLEGQNDVFNPLNVRVNIFANILCKEIFKAGKERHVWFGIIFMLKIVPKHPAMYKHMHITTVQGLGWWEENSSDSEESHSSWIGFLL